MKLTSFLSGLLILAFPFYSFANSGAAFESGPSARACGLGQSVVADISDSSAVFWNPAGLVHGVAGMGALRYRAFETDYTAVQLAGTMGNIGFGVGYLGASVGGIQYSKRVDGRAVSTGEIASYGASGWYLAAGIPVMDTVSVGVSAKVLSQQLGGFSASGIGADIGAQFKANSWCRVGLLLQNAIAPQFKWTTESGAVDPMNLNVIPGVALNVADGLTVMSQAVLQEARPAMVQWGVEWVPMSVLTLRVGHNSREVSVGTGIKLMPVTLDFAWSSTLVDGVDDTYRIGVGYGF